MAAISWTQPLNPGDEVWFMRTGNPANPARIYADPGLNDELPNPVIADGQGRIRAVYFAPEDGPIWATVPSLI